MRREWSVDEIIESLRTWEDRMYSESETKWLMNKAADLIEITKRSDNMADKQRVLNEIDKLVPDDFACGHIEITFKDDGAVVITINNKKETAE